MPEASLPPDVRRRLLLAAVVLAAGMVGSVFLAGRDAAWAAPAAAGVMVVVLLGAGVVMAPAAPVRWAPIAGAAVVALGVVAGALLLFPETDAWSIAVVSGGALYMVLLASLRDETGRPTLLAAAVVAAALLFAIWT